MADPSKDKVELILRRQKQLEDNQQLWHSLWEEVAELTNIQREDIEGNQQKGVKQGKEIFDGTGVSALQLASDGTYGNMVNPASVWHRLKFADDELNDVNEAKLWLQDVEAQIYSSLQNSNFYSEIRTYIEDGYSIGTANIFMEEDLVTGRTMFNVFHPREIFIAQDKFNEVDVVFRKYKITARQAIQSFGRKNVTENLLKRSENNPFSEFEFIHATFPREDRDISKIDSLNKKIASVWIQKDGKKIVRESGYDLSPYAIWRYKRSGNEVYGRSPACDAIVEIKRLNVISKTNLKAAQLSVDPPLNIPASMAGKVRWRPRGFNYFEEGTTDRISVISTGINYPIGVDREDRIRKIIEEHFKVDFFLLLARMEKREMTATEIIERAGEKAMVLASMIARFSSEALDKIINKVFEIEFRAGRLPELPPILQDRGGGGINIVYIGPLAQAQRLAFMTQGISRSIEAVAPIMALRSETADIPNWDEAVREIFETHGMPAKTINSRAIVQQIREARAKAEEAAQKQIQMAEGAETIKKLAQADKNVGGKLSEAMAGIAEEA